MQLFWQSEILRQYLNFKIVHSSIKVNNIYLIKKTPMNTTKIYTYKFNLRVRENNVFQIHNVTYKLK